MFLYGYSLNLGHLGKRIHLQTIIITHDKWTGNQGKYIYINDKILSSYNRRFKNYYFVESTKLCYANINELKWFKYFFKKISPSFLTLQFSIKCMRLHKKKKTHKWVDLQYYLCKGWKKSLFFFTPLFIISESWGIVFQY